MRDFITISKLQKNKIEILRKKLHLDGTEMYIDHLVPRNENLFKDSEDRKVLANKLTDNYVKRIHMSYWAEPTDYLENIDRKGLFKRFGSKKNIIAYYGDLTGEHIYKRWVQEYALAKDIGAEAVTFHLIDYFHIDGLWEFTNSRETIVKSLIEILSKFLSILDQKKLLKDGPIIEVENAGFGLEYGVQKAEDFLYVFNYINDTYSKVRIGWDINHLLHAVGFDKKKKRARFFLTKQEITPEMKYLEEKYGQEYDLFYSKWIEHNILFPQLLEKIGSIHLSDAPQKTEEIFRNGKMTGKYLKKMQTLKTDEEREEYGASVVKKYYDAHLPITNDIKQIGSCMKKINLTVSKLSIVHEFKNKRNNTNDLQKQISIFQ